MANTLVSYLRRVFEEVLVKVDQFTIYVDSVVLDMEVHKKVLLILGGPFLATGDALINVRR